jgi:hypothetical protein
MRRTLVRDYSSKTITGIYYISERQAVQEGRSRVVQRMPCVQAPEHLIFVSSTRKCTSPRAHSSIRRLNVFGTFPCDTYGRTSSFTRYGLSEFCHAGEQDSITEVCEAVSQTEMIWRDRTSAYTEDCGYHMTRALSSESRKHYATLGRANFGLAAQSCPAAEFCGSWYQAQLPSGSCGGSGGK